MSTHFTKDKVAKGVHIQAEHIWESLSSHLPYTYCKSAEGRKFHKQTALQYAEQLVALFKIY